MYLSISYDVGLARDGPPGGRWFGGTHDRGTDDQLGRPRAADQSSSLKTDASVNGNRFPPVTKCLHAAQRRRNDRLPLGPGRNAQADDGIDLFSPGSKPNQRRGRVYGQADGRAALPGLSNGAGQMTGLDVENDLVPPKQSDSSHPAFWTTNHKMVLVLRRTRQTTQGRSAHGSGTDELTISDVDVEAPSESSQLPDAMEKDPSVPFQNGRHYPPANPPSHGRAE